MKPLIDGDILLHEIGWSSQFKDKVTGEEILLNWELTQEILDDKIALICAEVDATEPPLIFISDSESLRKSLNRRAKFAGDDEVEFVKNFRYSVAKTKPYKGNRKNPKPFYFNNILHYLLAEYDCVVSEDGLEADDMMTIYQMSNNNTIICSRDKDLRICPGWHYSWECGGQKAIGPHFTDEIGSIELIEKKSTSAAGKVTTVKEIKGYGLKFFYSQMLTGDTADHIPGLDKVGAVAAYKALSDLNTHEELFNKVKQMYKDKMGDQSREYFMEQANLLWIIQKKGESYSIPKFT